MLVLSQSVSPSRTLTSDSIFALSISLSHTHTHPFTHSVFTCTQDNSAQDASVRERVQSYAPPPSTLPLPPPPVPPTTTTATPHANTQSPSLPLIGWTAEGMPLYPSAPQPHNHEQQQADAVHVTESPIFPAHPAEAAQVECLKSPVECLKSQAECLKSPLCSHVV